MEVALEKGQQTRKRGELRAECTWSSSPGRLQAGSDPQRCRGTPSGLSVENDNRWTVGRGDGL